MSSLDLFGKTEPTVAADLAPLQPGPRSAAVASLALQSGFVSIGEDFISIRGTEIPGPDGPVASYEIKREWTTYGNLCGPCAISKGSAANKLADLSLDFHCDDHERVRQRKVDTK